MELYFALEASFHEEFYGSSMKQTEIQYESEVEDLPLHTLVNRLMRAPAQEISTKTEARYKINIPELEFLKRFC